MKRARSRLDPVHQERILLKTTPRNVRLFAILARKSPEAVVFRRGPSRNVLLIRWNTANDTFELGQWFKGRIYERRCDLSPEGHLLVYFAANYRKPFYSWSAVSRPPFLKALALWPKGDGWGGGGHFQSRTRLALNHREGEMALASGFSVPRWLKISQFGDRPGWGEDDPVWSERLHRDGWTLISYPSDTKFDSGAKIWWKFSSPIIWRKSRPGSRKGSALEMIITGMHEKDGPWYLVEHRVVRENGRVETIGKSDWADWSHSGDLLFAKDGCLYRVPSKRGILASTEDATKIADFSKLTFEARKAPEDASKWPHR